jgi:hypothetical protein
VAPASGAASTAVALAVALAGPAAAYTTGPPPDRVGLCGAGPTCKDSGCHDDFPLDDGLAELRLELAGPPTEPLPAAFERGRLYRLLASVVDPDPTRQAFGFELAAVTGCPFAVPAGTLAVVEAERSRLDGDSGISYLSHACPGLPSPTPSTCGFLPFAPGGNAWRLDWQPGCDLDREVELDLAVNAADGTGSPTGDVIYLGSWRVAAPAACPPPIRTLRATRADCDPATPGEPELLLAWDPVPGAAGYTVHALDRAVDLALACTVAAEASGCLPLAGPALTLYTVLALCADGSPGPR